VFLSPKLSVFNLAAYGILAASFLSGVAVRASIAGWGVVIQPSRPVNGSPLLFRVKPPQALEELSGKWFGHDVFFNFDSQTKSWYALAGVGLETKPGTYTLELQGITRHGAHISFERRITTARAKYRRISVTVSKKFTEPSTEQLKTIGEDKQLKQSVFNNVTPQREWSGNFRKPVNAPVSDVFGTERTFNGKVQSWHQGLDYGVPSGTEVSALNSGTVLLARPLYFEGNCVVIDHGQGLLSLYLHLSDIIVKEGQLVKRGEIIGLSGGTGRATGPHLHVAVRWQGMYLSPATLMSLKLPAFSTPQ
jgi:murein DD-endopeptidase MepM/ murein hydrolase activator NlpD